MPLVSGVIPSMNDGVSQQPPQLRTRTQGDLQENALSDVAKGLTKRPPTQHLAKISTSALNSAFIHNIKRDNQNVFSLVIAPNGSISVYDTFTGTSLPVYYTENKIHDLATINFSGATATVTSVEAHTFGVNDVVIINNAGGVPADVALYNGRFTVASVPSATTFTYTMTGTPTANALGSPTATKEILNPDSYLNTPTPNTSIAATTIADYTYVVNKDVVVQKSTVADTARPPEAMVYVKVGAYGTTYTLTVTKSNITKTFSHNVPTSGGAGGGVSTDTATSAIALALKNGIVGTGLSNITVTIGSGGSILHFKSTDGIDFSVEVEDGRGGIYTQSYKDSTPTFAALPPKGISAVTEGFVIKVIGDNTKAQDDYYMKMTKPGTTGGWIYEEVAADGIVNNWDVETLPHRIVRNTDNTFSIQQVPWEGRGSGDDTTNPFKSILGKTINDIFFHQNRLGLLSGENVVFSEAGRFFSLFQNSVLNLLDTDPIDVAASSNVVNILKYAVPFSENLILFSDNSQFIVNAKTFLSPLTISIDITTQYEADLTTKPVGAGRFVFFPTNEGAYSGVMEYFVETAAVRTNDATPITAHIPSYIPGEVTLMRASSNASMMLLKTNDANSKNIVWVYSYSWQGSKKLQNSWSKFIFGVDDEVLYFDFIDRTITLLVQRGTDVFLEKIELGKDSSENDTNFGYSVLLDRRKKLVSIAEATNFAADVYPDPAQIFVKTGAVKTLAELQAENATDPISATNPAYAGVPATLKYRFSPQYYRIYNNIPITEGRLQIRRMNIDYVSSGYFTIDVTPTANRGLAPNDPARVDRDSRASLMSSKLVGGASMNADKNFLQAGNHKFSVGLDSGDADVTIVTDSHLPVTFQGGAWEGNFRSTNRRLPTGIGRAQFLQ